MNSYGSLNTPSTKQMYIKETKKRSMPGATASLMLVALTASSCTDTIHAFTESFSMPQHLKLSTSVASANLPRVHSPVHQDPFHKSNTWHTNSAFGKDLSHSSSSSSATNTALFYAPNQHTSKTAPMVAQAFFASHQRNRNPTKPKSRSDSTMPLSNSVLSSSDTLPAFPTAHGLLSPETVMRMDIMTSNNGSRDKALDMFLDTYKKKGPMACLPMLSDENVLPRLTEAMRDILI